MYLLLHIIDIVFSLFLCLFNNYLVVTLPHIIISPFTSYNFLVVLECFIDDSLTTTLLHLSLLCSKLVLHFLITLIPTLVLLNFLNLATLVHVLPIIMCCHCYPSFTLLLEHSVHSTMILFSTSMISNVGPSSDA